MTKLCGFYQKNANHPVDLESQSNSSRCLLHNQPHLSRLVAGKHINSYRLILVKRLFLVVIISLLLVACGRNTTTATPAIPDASNQVDPPPPVSNEGAQGEVLVEVNGQPITRNQYERELARFQAGQAALGIQPDDEAAYRQQVLDLLVENELIRQRAAAQGITISDGQIDAEIEDTLNDLLNDGQAETPAEAQEYFEGWLQGNYYTREEFREIIRLTLMTQQLREPVIASVPVTAEHVRARHILVNSREDAEEVLTRLNNGEDFSALAAEYSVDVTTASNSGDLGWFARGSLLVPQVEEVAFSQDPNQISDIIETDWGFHIIQTLEFDDNYEVTQETRQRLIEDAIEQWRLGLRTDASIVEVNPI